MAYNTETFDYIYILLIPKLIQFGSIVLWGEELMGVVIHPHASSHTRLSSLY
jgi:hypothetical protein